jgi:hypothetical protein
MGVGCMQMRPPGLKPELILELLRGAQAPLFHENGWIDYIG